MSDLCVDCGSWYQPGKDGKNIEFHTCMGKINNKQNCNCYSCDCGRSTCWICCNDVPPTNYTPCTLHKKCGE